MLLTALTARHMIHDDIFNKGIYLSFSEWAITAQFLGVLLARSLGKGGRGLWAPLSVRRHSSQ